MDVLKPELVWVNNKCYRFFESGGWASSSEITSYAEDYFQPVCDQGEPCDMDIEIVRVNNSKFKHTFNCPSLFYPFIIGTKGAMRIKLETETGTTIQIPKTGQDITIIGNDKKNIISARQRINLLMESSKKKLRPTHFISIPLATDDIITNYEAFKNDVLNGSGETARRIEPSLFQEPLKLHLTIVVLLLLDDDEIKRAAELLQDCKRNVIEPILREHGPVTIQVKGIENMTDDPTNAKILYAKINTENDVLQTLADKIALYYADSDFIQNPQNTHVKLHMTLMNTVYKARAERPARDKKMPFWNNNITFDASSILKDHSERVFGEVPLKDIHLSCLGTANESYYKADGIITLFDDK